MKLLISYLTNQKRHYTFRHFIELLDKSIHKDQWKLFILIDSDTSTFYTEELKRVSIPNVEIQEFCYADNYIWKLRHSCDIAIQQNIPYMMKCDNDIFMTAPTFDFMFENLEKLAGKDETNQNKHLTLGPVLSTGIPTVEYFMEQFMDHDAVATLRELFLQTEFVDRDHTKYKQLNAHTLYSEKWNKNEFFENLKNTVYPLRGVHPIRINDDAIQFVNQYVLNHKELFYQDWDKEIICDISAPYLCNSVFCIRTDMYHSILYDHKLFRDAYDEIPLNKYAWNHNMDHLFVKNGFAIHMYYNWNNNYIEKEKEFCQAFFGEDSS
jgi:hypothetical protein